MIQLADSRQMKAVDAYSIQNVGIPSLVLMERAAYATALHIEEEMKNKCLQTVISVCGSGNNGGDGLALARILHTMGFDSRWYMAGNKDRMTKETDTQMRILQNMGIRECTDINEFAHADVIVDAIFGIGLTRNVEGEFAWVITQINESPAFVCAVDIPSGISTDTGAVLGCAVRADMTVTFGVHKIGLALYPGAEYAGRVFAENIGFAPEAVKKAEIDCFAFEKNDITVNMPVRKARSNKGSYGKVLVIAGSKNMGGACYFAAASAYRCGCGLVRVFTVKENHDVILQRLPEAVLTVYDSDHFDYGLLDEALSWADSVVLGPGLSTQDYAKDIVLYVLEKCRVPLLIDADGLNILAQNPKFMAKLPKGTVLTPHVGEMARLTGQSVKDVSDHLFETCKKFAKEHGVICVLKDARTVISDGGRTFINLSGNDGMATGGSGDVLSGIIGALLTGKTEPLRAAAFGCYIHGCAGDTALKEKGRYGLLASDIIKYMPEIIG